MQQAQDTLLVLKNFYERLAVEDEELGAELNEAVQAWTDIVFRYRDAVERTITTFVHTIAQLESVAYDLRAQIINLWGQWEQLGDMEKLKLIGELIPDEAVENFLQYVERLD